MTILVPVHRALSTKLAGRSFNAVSRLGYNSWLARVNHNSDNYESKSTSPQASLARFYSISTRSYATSVARKPVGRPKAHTGRTPAKRTTKAATTKKPGPKTPAGKARVGAKPKGKATKAKATTAKAKPKPKPKTPVKKAPTQRALATERIAKERALKKAALLDSPKLLPQSAWQVVFGESLKGSHGLGEPHQLAKEAGQKYKNMIPEDKEV